MATLLGLMVCAQGRITVSGTVTAKDDGQPIPGVSVLVKGTKSGTFTDENGKYSLPNVAANAILQFSSIGYSTIEIPLNGRAVVNAELNVDAMSLDETIIVAYGTAQKGTFTGAASVVRSNDIKDVPTISFENALNGKVAGLQVTQGSGQAGSTTTMHIRGIGSMNASTEPLYVIDGVPVIQGNIGQMSDYNYNTNNVMSTLNPDDIESITILKDAAASALYGSRAANGVVVITTKRGRIGKPTVSFKASLSFSPSWATKNYEIASAYDQAAMEYEVFYDYAITPKSEGGRGQDEAGANSYALGQINTAARWKNHGYIITSEGTGRYAKLNIGVVDGAEKRLNKYYDWEKALFSTGIYQSYDIAVSGGSDQATYYSSLSYTRDKGRALDNNFTRISGRLNLNQKIGKFFEFMTNVNIGKTKTVGFNDTRNMRSNHFMATRNMLFQFYWPYYYNDENEPYKSFNSYCYNSLYYRGLWDNSARAFKVQVSETATAHILPGLDLKTIFSYDNTDSKDHYYINAEHYNGSSSKGTVHEMSTNYSKIVSSTTLNYNTTFAEKHSLGLLLGFEAEKNKIEFIRATGTFLPGSMDVVAVAGNKDASAYNWGNSLASVLSKAEYGYDNRYYASASFRRDGSSKLGENNRWGNFWSLAASWRLSNENFIKDNVAWISNLRLRASYGVNGTLPSDNYGWRSLSRVTSKYMSNPGSVLYTIGDAELTWETNYTTNLALEFGLFNQRLYGTIEWFTRDSKNLLQDVPLPTATGFSSTLKNIGKINNRGFELELGGEIIRNSKWKWDASLTASFISSKVKKLYGGEDIIWYDPTGGDDRAQYIYREGEPTLAFYGKEWGGVNPDNGRQVWIANIKDASGNPITALTSELEAKGYFLYNNKIAHYDYDMVEQKIIGNATPKVYGGLSTSASWKGISLGLNFIYKLGAKFYDGAEKDVNDDGYYWTRTRSAYVAKNRWTTPGQQTDIPQIRGIDLTDAMEYSSRFLHNGNFLRLKTISLGYTLPKNWVSRVKMQNARVFFSGTNLLTFAKWKEVDPEVGPYGTRGWETPFSKTYTFGIEFTF